MLYWGEKVLWGLWNDKWWGKSMLWFIIQEIYLLSERPGCPALTSCQLQRNGWWANCFKSGIDFFVTELMMRNIQLFIPEAWGMLRSKSLQHAFRLIGALIRNSTSFSYFLNPLSQVKNSIFFNIFNQSVCPCQYMLMKINSISTERAAGVCLHIHIWI